MTGAALLNEWEAAALVLSAVPYGESSILTHLFTAEHGRVHALVRGGQSRQNVSIWQPGNLVHVQYRVRNAGQLGNVSGELVHPSAARLLNEPLALLMMQSCCVLVDGVLAEFEPHEEIFFPLVQFVSHLSLDPDWVTQGGMSALVRWECDLLSASGFGLDLMECAVTGQRNSLCFVSPRSGRAVSEEGAGVWRARLLRLPPFLLNSAHTGDWNHWLDGLTLTGHFLSRDAFGQRHLSLPNARHRLVEAVASRVVTQNPDYKSP